MEKDFSEYSIYISKSFLLFGYPILKNKYFLSAIIFFIWIFFFDTYSIMVQINQKKDMNKIIQDIEYYKEEISKDQEIIDIIKTDSLTPNFEKYLR